MKEKTKNNHKLGVSVFVEKYIIILINNMVGRVWKPMKNSKTIKTALKTL